MLYRAKSSSDSWKVINRYRKNTNEEITEEEWRNHFKEPLGGNEETIKPLLIEEDSDQ